MKLAIHTDRTFKDRAEFEEYLDFMVEEGAITSGIASTLRTKGFSTLYNHNLDEHVATTYTVTDE